LNQVVVGGKDGGDTILSVTGWKWRYLQFPDILHVKVVHRCTVRDGLNLALNLISEHQVSEVLRIKLLSVCPYEYCSLSQANLQSRRDDGNVANWGFSRK